MDYRCFVPGPPVVLAGAPGGRVAGLRLAVKDLIDIAGSITGAGNPDWRRTHPAASRHAWAVQRLLDAGARIIGRTITDELAFSLEGENAHDGTPINPACPGRLPGGSSSGSAVAVAAGLADAALGTDTGGSVRVPAAFCGVFGFRPSHGAVPLDGVFPFAPSLDTLGWFAADAAMLARLGDVLLPPAAPARPCTSLLLAEDALALADADVAAALRHFVARSGLPANGVDAAPVALRELTGCYAAIQAMEIRALHAAWLQDVRPRFGAAIAPRFAGIFAVTAQDHAAAAALRVRVRAHLDALFAAHPGALLVLPAAPCIALRPGLATAALGDFYARSLAIGALAGLAGLPQAVVPAGRVAGCPVGVGVVGPRGADRWVLDSPILAMPHYLPSGTADGF